MSAWEPATWGQIEPGDTVLGADHHEWTVTNVHGAAVTDDGWRRLYVRSDDPESAVKEWIKGEG